MAFQPGDTVGPYRVVKQLAAGASGEVFRVQHCLTNRVEALKVLKGGTFESVENEQRFLREIQVQASLNHANIASVHNAFVEGARLVMAMELVEGQRLDTILASRHLTLAEAAGFACQILDALEFAHNRGVVHRDVSSANVIVTEAGILKLTDFGLAKTGSNLRLTQHGVPIGSYPYMSPEQVRGLPDVDARSDLYSAGVLLYEMVTRQLPFPASDPFAMMQAHVSAEPVPASEWMPWLPAGWDEMFAIALAKDPGRRFATAGHFQSTLRSLSWALVSSSPPAPASAAPKRRHRLFHPVLALTAATAIAVAIGWRKEQPPLEIPPGPLPVLEQAKPSAFPQLPTSPPEEPVTSSRAAEPKHDREEPALTAESEEQQPTVGRKRNPVVRALGKVFRVGRKREPEAR